MGKACQLDELPGCSKIIHGVCAQNCQVELLLSLARRLVVRFECFIPSRVMETVLGLLHFTTSFFYG